MNYLLAPLHDHFDLGFGATGNAFMTAAADLAELEDAKPAKNLFNANIPINFLYRHAIELFLKSGIVVFHRRFKLPYGDVAFDAEPKVLVGSEWLTFTRVHGIAKLWTYLRLLFVHHAEWLSQHTTVDWTFAPHLDALVELIEQGDPRSTFFRYPTTGNPSADVSKSSMTEASGDELMGAMKKSAHSEHKNFIVVVQTENKEFVKSYVYSDEKGAELHAALRDFAQTCYDLHAAMRHRLCGGW